MDELHALMKELVGKKFYGTIVGTRDVQDNSRVLVQVEPQNAELNALLESIFALDINKGVWKGITNDYMYRLWLTRTDAEHEEFVELEGETFQMVIESVDPWEVPARLYMAGYEIHVRRV